MYYYRIIIYRIYFTVHFLIILMFKVSTLEDFPLEVIEKCNPRLLYCSNCAPMKVLSSSWEPHSRFPWCVSFSCGSCQTIWIACKYCTRVKSHFCYGSELLHHHKDKHLSDVSDVKSPILKHLLGEHSGVELCEEQQSKSCKLDVLCSAIDVSRVGDEQTTTNPSVDQSATNIVTEVEWSDNLGEETIATNSCKEQSPTDHVAEVEGYYADKTGSVVALLHCSVSDGDAPLYGVDINNVNFPFPDEMPKI
jgi:hypothetical protein